MGEWDRRFKELAQQIKVSKKGIDVVGSKINVSYYEVRKETDPLNVFDKSWEERYNALADFLRNNHSQALYEFEVLIMHEL